MIICYLYNIAKSINNKHELRMNECLKFTNVKGDATESQERAAGSGILVTEGEKNEQYFSQ